MYTHIMTPVDLAHVGTLGSALDLTADLARHFGARVTFVGVTGVQPSAIAPSPEAYADKLRAFAAAQAAAGGYDASAHPITAHDPAIEIDRDLVAAAEEIGADLIVAATHVPSIFGGASHGGAVATQSRASVLLVRN